MDVTELVRWSLFAGLPDSNSSLGHDRWPGLLPITVCPAVSQFHGPRHAPRLPTRAEVWIDKSLGKYVYGVLFVSLALLWLL